MLVDDIEAFDVLWRHLSHDLSTVHIFFYFSVARLPRTWEVAKWSCNSQRFNRALGNNIRGEQSNYCPNVVDKTWKTVARGRRQSLRATVSQIFSTTIRDNGWTVIIVLLPNFKSPIHCQQYANDRCWSQDIWPFVTSFKCFIIKALLFDTWPGHQ